MQQFDRRLAAVAVPGEDDQNQGQEVQSSEPVIPEGPIGRHLLAFIDVIGSGKEQDIRGFIKEHYAKSAQKNVTIDQRLGVFARLHERTGGLEIRCVEQRGEHIVMLRAQTVRDNEWDTYHLQFEPKAPNGIVSWSMNVEGTGRVSLRSKEY